MTKTLNFITAATIVRLDNGRRATLMVEADDGTMEDIGNVYTDEEEMHYLCELADKAKGMTIKRAKEVWLSTCNVLIRRSVR